MTEHKRATRNGDINNHIAEHHLQTNHRIDWDSATVPPETIGPFARGKASSLPNVIATNSPRWDEKRNHGKDESNQKPR